MVKKNFLKISNLIISPEFPSLIVPEIGINHNGKIEHAFNLVDAAKRAGAKIIKHQTHVFDDEMSVEAKNIKPGNSKKDIYTIIKECSLSEEEEYKLSLYVKKSGLVFLSTPFSKKGVDRLIKFDVKAFKVGSGEFSNESFVNYIAKFNKPMILSTGMHNLEEIDKVVIKLKRINNKFALLHCTSIYPTPDDKVRLNSILQMRKRYSRVIGLSDHTNNCFSSYGAVALGACIIEKHFVDKKARKGPDMNSSIDSKSLKELIKGCETIFKQRSGDKNEILKEESKTKKFAL